MQTTESRHGIKVTSAWVIIPWVQNLYILWVSKKLNEWPTFIFWTKKQKKSLRAKCTYCPNHIHIKYSRPQMEVARWQKRILRGKVTRERCRRERPLCLHGGCKGLGTGTPNVDHTACHKELLTELTSPSSNRSTGGCNFLYISHGGQAWKLKCSSLPGH